MSTPRHARLTTRVPCPAAAAPTTRSGRGIDPGPRRVAFAVLLTLLLAAPGVRAQDVAAAARDARRAGDAAGAVTLLDGADAERGDDPELLGLLGLCLMDAGDLQRARTLADARADYAGDGFRLHLFLGRWRLQLGEVEAAELHLERACALKERPVEALLLLGRCLLAQNRTGRGLEIAERLRAVRDDLGRRLAADLYVGKGDRLLERAARNVEAIPRALEAYQAAYELVPDDRHLAGQLLDLLIQAHRVPEADALVETVHPLEDEPASHHLYRARIRVAANDPPAAEQHYRKALGHAPKHADATIGLARLLVDRGARDEADALLTELLDRQPDQGEAHLVLGLSAVAANDPARAEPHLRRAVELRPQDSQALYQLGRVLMRVGKREEGRELLERYREG